MTSVQPRDDGHAIRREQKALLIRIPGIHSLLGHWRPGADLRCVDTEHCDCHLQNFFETCSSNASLQQRELEVDSFSEHGLSLNESALDMWQRR